MNQSSIFETLDFEPTVYKGQDVYRGPDGRYYSIVETNEYVIARIQSDEWEKPEDRLKIFKISTPEKTEEIIYHAIRSFQKRGLSLFQPEIIYREIRKHIMEVDPYEMSDQQIMNMCLLYDACVKAGGLSFIICDECKRILNILLTEE